MKTKPVPKRANWIPFPHPIRENEVRIDENRITGERTLAAIGRQVEAMGFESADE